MPWTQQRSVNFDGASFSSGSYVKGLQNLRSTGQIRTHIKVTGFDKAYAKLTAIPGVVKKGIHAQAKKNARALEKLAKLYVPYDTGDLHDSISTETVGGWMPSGGKGEIDWVAQVSANTHYAFWVEEDVHPSYKWRGRTPSVFGARQGPPQGAHYMARAMADSRQANEVSMAKAVEKAIYGAIKGISGGYNKFTKGRLDFDTRTASKASAFVESALDAGLASETSSGMINLPVMGMNVRGFE